MEIEEHISVLDQLCMTDSAAHPSARLLDLIMIEIVGNLMDCV